MKKSLCFTISLFLLACIHAKGQLVVASSGGQGDTSTQSLSWTIGESITETISNGTHSLTQGFQQSKLVVQKTDNVLIDDIKISAVFEMTGAISGDFLIYDE